MLKELLTSETYQHTPRSLNPSNNHLCICKSYPWHIFHWVRSEYSLSIKKIVCYMKGLVMCYSGPGAVASKIVSEYLKPHKRHLVFYLSSSKTY